MGSHPGAELRGKGQECHLLIPWGEGGDSSLWGEVDGGHLRGRSRPLLARDTEQVEEERLEGLWKMCHLSGHSPAHPPSPLLWESYPPSPTYSGLSQAALVSSPLATPSRGHMHTVMPQQG